MLLLELFWICSRSEAASGAEECCRCANAGDSQEENVFAFTRHFGDDIDDDCDMEWWRMLEEVMMLKHVAHWDQVNATRQCRHQKLHQSFMR